LTHMAMFVQPLLIFGETLHSFSTGRAIEMKVDWDPQPEALYLTAKRAVPGVGGPAMQTQRVRIPWTSIAYYTTTDVEQPRPAAVETPRPNATPPRK